MIFQEVLSMEKQMFKTIQIQMPGTILLPGTTLYFVGLNNDKYYIYTRKICDVSIDDSNIKPLLNLHLNFGTELYDRHFLTEYEAKVYMNEHSKIQHKFVHKFVDLTWYSPIYDLPDSNRHVLLYLTNNDAMPRFLGYYSSTILDDYSGFISFPLCSVVDENGRIVKSLLKQNSQRHGISDIYAWRDVYDVA